MGSIGAFVLPADGAVDMIKAMDGLLAQSCNIDWKNYTSLKKRSELRKSLVKTKRRRSPVGPIDKRTNAHEGNLPH